MTPKRHTRAAIGTALGVSKQALYRRFITPLTQHMKAQAARAKQARRTGSNADVAVVETAETLRRVRPRENPEEAHDLAVSLVFWNGLPLLPGQLR